MRINHLKPVISILILTSSTLAGCQTAPSQPSTHTNDLNKTQLNAVPNWLLNPPQDNAQFLYGVGQGQNRQSAINSALADLSSKLGITVNSQFKTELSVKDRGFELIKRDSQKSVTTQVNAIKISQYQVVEAYAPLPAQVSVFVKTDRQKLFKTYQKTLDAQLKSYQTQQIHLAKQGPLSQFLNTAQVYEQLPNFTQKRSVAESLNPKMNSQPYLAFEETVVQNYDAQKQQILFSLQASSKTDKAFAKALSNKLSNQKLLAPFQKRAFENLQIKLLSTSSLSQAYGFYIGRYQINLQVFEGRQQIGGKQLSFKGQGTQNYQNAENQAVQKFQKLLEDEGLWRVLGIGSKVSSSD